MTTIDDSKCRTITLTGAPPVRIRDAEWPIILQEESFEDEGAKLDRRRWIKVRRHADGRWLVYGGLDTTIPLEKNLRGGELVEPGRNLALVIRRVSARIHASELAAALVAQLPSLRAVEI